MIIREIVFENFRSFYGKTRISLNDGLSLFIGDNGDGKTTFIEALEWLFNVETRIMNPELISRKKVSEMNPGEVDVLKVSLNYEHNGWKSIEKSFLFEKTNLDVEPVRLFDFRFKGWQEDGSQRIEVDGKSMLNSDFDTSVRRYSLFKGEHNLNVFSKAGALSFLVETFSNVRMFKPLLEEGNDSGFLPHAVNQSFKNYQSEVRSNTKNNKLEAALRSDIDKLRSDIHSYGVRLNTYQDNINYFSGKLSELEGKSEAGQKLNDINKNLEILKDDRRKVNNRIDERYAAKLLDNMWILVDSLPILQDYQEKIHSINRIKRELEDEHKREEARKETLIEVTKSIKERTFTPLEVLVPDEETMKEMISEEVCKVCGREAKKDSDAYNFMVAKLEELLESKKPKVSEKAPPFFANNYMRDLERIRTHITYNNNDLAQYNIEIKDSIELNQKLNSKVSILDSKILEIEMDKLRLLAENTEFSEDILINNHQFVNDWYRGRREAERQFDDVESKIDKAKKDLKELEIKYEELSTDSNANLYKRIHTAFEKIRSSFENAKEKNTEDFLNNLEKIANKYLEKLNVEGFRGYVRVRKISDGSLGIQLRDNQDILITSPNQALKTTMYISVLFAVSELTSLKRENNYPLIFDAPTSSFAAPMENDFFNVISNESSNLKKQIIILSKSFLTDNGELSWDQINSLNASIYRIEKSKPFDKTDLSTIQTVIKKIK